MFRANYHKSIRIALFVLFIVTVLLLLPEKSDTEYSQGCPSRVSQRYGIMLDAGSQGSRIHVYQFSSCGKKVLSVLASFYPPLPSILPSILPSFLPSLITFDARMRYLNKLNLVCRPLVINQPWQKHLLFR